MTNDSDLITFIVMEKFTCHWIYNMLVVLCDGTVVCGCADPNAERPLGHLEKDSILAIWNSRKVQQIRQDLNQGFSPFCLNCGLKTYLAPEAPIPQRSVHQKILPRIFFEPTVLCNISCYKAVCSKESNILQTRNQSQFPMKSFESLIDEIGSNLIRLDFFNYGDPFVHPQAVDMIEYVKQKHPGTYLYTSTNGLMLTDEKIDRLVNCALDEITFSVDGADMKTYQKYRCGGDFNLVLNIMKTFVDIRNQAKREIPFINWRYILFKWNDSKRKMNAARKLASKISVDRLTWEITDHPPDAVSKKYKIGSSAWKKIYYEIWDSSQISNAIPQKKFLAKISLSDPLCQLTAGKSKTICVTVTNIGGALFRNSTTSGRRTVRLGIQLYNQNRQLIDRDFARAFLPRNLSFAESADISIEIPKIKSPGIFFFKFDMVCEGIDWFESTGSDVVWQQIKVV